jgi:DnaK suppressor protein
LASMRRREMERFRKQLLAKRDDLLGRVQTARSSELEANDADAPDLGDRALSNVTLDLSYQLSASERDLLRRIDAAVDRIDVGMYGVCVHCGKKVQMARLEAVPWARHCVDCQELQDRGEI